MYAHMERECRQCYESILVFRMSEMLIMNQRFLYRNRICQISEKKNMFSFEQSNLSENDKDFMTSVKLAV